MPQGANPPRGGDAKPGISTVETARPPAQEKTARQEGRRTTGKGALPHDPSQGPRQPSAPRPRGARHRPRRRRRHRRFRRDFTASSANPGNVFTAGTLSCRNSEGQRRDPHRLQHAARRRRASTGTSTSRTPARSAARSRCPAARLIDSDTTNPLSGKLNVDVVDCGASAAAPRRPAATATTSSSTPARSARWAPGHSSRRSAPSPAATQAPLPVHASRSTARPDNGYQGDTLDGRVQLERRVGSPTDSDDRRHARPPRRPRALRAAARGGRAVRRSAGRSPRSFGWQRYVIVCGSMTGTYDRGSLVLRRGRPGRRAEGRRRDHLPAAGRAPASTTWSPTGSPRSPTDPTAGRVFRTKGDANPVADPWTFTLAGPHAGPRARRRPLRRLRRRRAVATARRADAPRRPPRRC